MFDISMFGDKGTQNIVKSNINAFAKNYGKGEVSVSFSSNKAGFMNAVTDKEAKHIFYAGHGLPLDAGFSLDDGTDMVMSDLDANQTEATFYAYSCFSKSFSFRNLFARVFPNFKGKSEGLLEFDQAKFNEFMGELNATLPTDEKK